MADHDIRRTEAAHRRAPRLRESLQLGPVDCGPANLRALCAGWGIQVTNAEVRAACGMNNAGTNMVGLLRAARQLGLAADLMPLDLHDLRDHADLYLPAIVKIDTPGDQLHFVTIHRIAGSRVTVMDPAVGRLTLPFDELWPRVARQQLSIAREKIDSEQHDPENVAEALARLRDHGISAGEARSWIERYGLFVVDDCLKYAATMRELDSRFGFGRPAHLLRKLLGDAGCHLPEAFDSGVGVEAVGELEQMNSPLVLVCRGPVAEAKRRSGPDQRPRLRLLRFLAKHWRAWLPLAVLALGISVLGVAFPLATGWVIDGLDLGWPPLVFMLVVVALTQLFHQYLVYASAVGVGRVLMAITTRLRSGLLLRFHQLPEWTMKDRMPGELMSRLEESQGLARFATSWGLGVLTASLTLLLAVALMIHLWWPILALSLGVMGAGSMINEVFARRLRRLSRDLLESSAQFHSRLMDLFRGLEALRLTGAGTSALFGADPKLAATVRAVYRQQDWSILTQAAMGIVETTTIVGFSFLTYWGLSRGLVTPGMLITGLTLSTLARTSLKALLEHRKSLEQQVVVLERCEEFIEASDATVGAAPATVAMTATEEGWHSFTMKNVSFSHDSRRNVLSNLDLELRPGRSVCLLGRSGAGKSTLMDLMCGILEPTAGDIAIDGKTADDERRRSWGVHRIEQEPVLIDGTIRDNILCGLPNPGIARLTQAAEIAAFLPVLESDVRAWDRRVGGRRRGLSGGEARRLCLARAVLRQPRILLMDETLSAVGARLRGEIMADLLRDRSDRAVLLATHDPMDAFLCDQVVILASGNIVETGAALDLQADPDSRFARLLALGKVAA